MNPLNILSKAYAEVYYGRLTPNSEFYTAMEILHHAYIYLAYGEDALKHYRTDSNEK